MRRGRDLAMPEAGFVRVIVDGGMRMKRLTMFALEGQ